jgi:hypothetical protein
MDDEKGLGSNPLSGSLPGYSSEGENLDLGVVCSWPSVNIDGEEGESCVGNDTLPWLPKCQGRTSQHELNRQPSQSSTLLSCTSPMPPSPCG